jgi:hypothetical protein
MPQLTSAAPARTGGRGLAVEALVLVEGLVVSLVGAERHGLLLAQGQDPETGQAVVEETVDLVLQRLVEVDEHVAAHHHVELVERAVGHQVVLGEHDVGGQGGVEAGAVVGGHVVLGKGARSARGQVVLGVLPHLLQREDAVAGPGQHRLVDVGGVDAGALQQPLLGQQDGERERLLAGGAARVPDAEEGIGAQHGHHRVAEGEVEAGVAEHGGDVDGQVEQQPFHARGVVEEPLQQPRQGGQAFELAPPGQPPPQRRPGVVPEVEPVAPEHRLQQQVQLDLFQVVVVDALAGALDGHALGDGLHRTGDGRRRRRTPLRVPAGGGHWYSHTRMSESSCSTSTGLVM